MYHPPHAPSIFQQVDKGGLVVRFKIQNAEEREHLKELVQSGIVGVLDTWTPEGKFPKYYIYFEGDVALRGVSWFVYESFKNTQEIDFVGFCGLLIKQGAV